MNNLVELPKKSLSLKLIPFDVKTDSDLSKSALTRKGLKESAKRFSDRIKPVKEFYSKKHKAIVDFEKVQLGKIAGKELEFRKKEIEFEDWKAEIQREFKNAANDIDNMYLSLVEYATKLKGQWLEKIKQIDLEVIEAEKKKSFFEKLEEKIEVEKKVEEEVKAIQQEVSNKSKTVFSAPKGKAILKKDEVFIKYKYSIKLGMEQDYIDWCWENRIKDGLLLKPSLDGFKKLMEIEANQELPFVQKDRFQKMEKEIKNSKMRKQIIRDYLMFKRLESRVMNKSGKEYFAAKARLVYSFL